MAKRYVAPVDAQKRRLDQGIDYQGNPGDPVVAIGRARVDAVKADPRGFGKAIYYTLLDGPMKGRQIYVGHAQPVVHAGETIGAGTPVAVLLEHSLGNASNLKGWTEIGFARNGVPDPGTAADFQAFVDGLKPGAATSVDVSASTTAGGETSQPAAAASPVQEPPSPYTDPLPIASGISQPQALPPGAVPAEQDTTRQYQQTWQRIAADPWAPPETANYSDLWQGG
jgi:hypothetical protein